MEGDGLHPSLGKAVGYSGSIDTNYESFRHKGMVVD